MGLHLLAFPEERIDLSVFALEGYDEDDPLPEGHDKTLRRFSEFLWFEKVVMFPNVTIFCVSNLEFDFFQWPACPSKHGLMLISILHESVEFCR